MTVIIKYSSDYLIFIIRNFPEIFCYRSFLLNLINDHKKGKIAQIDSTAIEIPIPPPEPKTF